MPVRLQKYLAECGVASRRRAEELILAGLVEVNGVRETALGVKIDELRDVVKYDGRIVKPETRKVYVMLNKPEGCVTTARDQFGRPTVMDYVADIKERLIPVGRLDYDTSGLLIMTNDGALAYKLTHPRHNVKKTYLAIVEGAPTSAALRLMRAGTVIDGHRTAPAEVRVIDSRPGDSPGSSRLLITIREGRNRQVRKMCENAGHRTISLTRTAIGELYLGGLKKGGYRFLTRDEVEYLKNKI